MATHLTARAVSTRQLWCVNRSKGSLCGAPHKESKHEDQALCIRESVRRSRNRAGRGAITIGTFLLGHAAKIARTALKDAAPIRVTALMVGLCGKM